MASSLGNSTPPASPHANWSTAPLLPRKSPERRRLGLGHKSTQSLNLPRSRPLQLEEINTNLTSNEQSLGIARSSDEASTSPSLSPARTRTSMLVITPSATDPKIVSPRPRRHTDVRVLEAAQLIADGQDQTRTDMQSEEVLPSASVPATQMGRLQHLQSTALPARRHIRGARSLSPTRHERSESMPFSSAYLDNRHNSRPQDSPKSSLHLITTGLQDFNLAPSSNPSPSSSPARYTASPNRHAMPLQKSNGPESESPLQDSRSVSKSQRSRKCLTDDELESHLEAVAEKSFSSTDAELDWCVAILCLGERRVARLRHISSTSSPIVSARMSRLENLAKDSIARLSHESARAMFLQGTIYETGRAGTQVDRKQAFMLYKTAAREGCPRADYRLGMQFERIGDIRTACETYERGAGADDSACLYRMGLIILRGQYGYPVDEQKGTNCIQLSAISADHDTPQGAYAWALLLSGETTLPVTESALRRDNREAVKYFELAASLGSTPAQVRLAKAHEFNELECAYSPQLSYHYYNMAAHGDNPEGDMGVSKWLLAGSDDGLIAKDEEKSFFHASLAASKALASAEFAMGYFHEVGIACQADLPRAQYFYKRASEHGSVEARGRLDGLSRTGTLSRHDHEHNVRTRIHERRATIRLNQKIGGRYHSRNQSSIALSNSPSRPPFSPSKAGLETLHDVTEPAQTSPETVVQRLQVSLPFSADGKEQDASPVEHKTSRPEVGTAWPSINKGPSSVLESSHLNGHSRTPTQARADSLADYDTLKSEWTKSPIGHTLEDPGSSNHARIHSWSNQAGSSSALGSPNLAPSEVSALQEDSGLSSPRPESSVSNIPPYMRSHNRIESKAFSTQSHISAAGSGTGLETSSDTSISMASSRRAGPTTFEEMDIPMANKKKEDCVVM